MRRLTRGRELGALLGSKGRRETLGRGRIMRSSVKAGGRMRDTEEKIKPRKKLKMRGLTRKQRNIRLKDIITESLGKNSFGSLRILPPKPSSSW